tara:strand:- start:6382 stop:6969 length:588 start_codon:yes stop_codon:yes gene_type:complete
MNEIEMIEDYLNNQASCMDDLKKLSENIKMIFQKLISARDNGNSIFIMGNGGSASTATHFTSDLLKTSIIKNEKRFKAHSLSDNIPVILAWANDTEYKNIFSGQLESFLKKDDIVIGISGSGNSENVISAIEFANTKNAITVTLTGKDGGKLAKLSEINLTVPSDDMLTIETMHLMICHLITTMIRSGGEPQFSY